MTEKDELLQAKERELAEAQQQVSTYIMCVMLHVLIVSWSIPRLQVTENKDLLQAKERELAETQQKLKQKVRVLN